MPQQQHCSRESEHDGNCEKSHDDDQPRRKRKRGRKKNREWEKEQERIRNAGQLTKPNLFDSPTNLPCSRAPSAPNRQIPNSSLIPIATSTRQMTENRIIPLLVDPERNREKMTQQPSAVAVVLASANQSVDTPSINEHILPVDTPVEVIISDCTTVAKFFIRYCCREAKLQELMKEIQIWGPQAEPVNVLENNLQCLLKHSNGWCRVRIVEVVKERDLCQSLDYGRFHSVPIKIKDSFRIMKDSFKQIPFFAIRVKLAGANKGKCKITEAEKKKLIDKKYLMDIVREGIVKVVRLRTVDGEDFSLRLFNRGLEDLRR